MTTALERVCATLDIALAPTDPYAPHQKGKVERANRTVDQELLSGLPFFTEGPRAADGRLYGPSTAPMTLQLFVGRSAAWALERSFRLVDQVEPLSLQRERAAAERAIAGHVPASGVAPGPFGVPEHVGGATA